MDGFDLRDYQQDGEKKEEIRSIMGKVLSGRSDYEAVIEEKKEVVRRCEACNWVLQGGEKFCPECGHKFKQEE